MPQVPGSDQPMPGRSAADGCPDSGHGPGSAIERSGLRQPEPAAIRLGPRMPSIPNYAAVTYPNQYSASAWPYIGPFYPYPQVPLNWRKVTLEWSDGHWDLNFDSRTDRWWWFLNPKNW